MSLLAACSEVALSDLGERSSGWIGEVATTTTTVPTPIPSPTREAIEAEWVNDEFGAPPPDARIEDVVTRVVARTADDSRFLQASRAEIAVAVPLVEFPSEIPKDAGFITSQIVVDARTLRLASDPTVAFGLWTVEPYTRSRSVGQVAVLTVATDSTGAENAAADVNSVCATAGVDRLCSVEYLGRGPVWRFETSAGVSHVWFGGVYRYELEGRPDQDEEVLHRVIDSLVPLVQLLDTGTGLVSVAPDGE